MTNLQFIKKSRPKLKEGDIFYYYINNQYYFGIVLLTKLDHELSDNIAITVLLVNYSESDISNFSVKSLEEKIKQLYLIAPPIVINKKVWNLGFFANLNKNLDVSEIFRNLRFECWDHICDYKYNHIHDIPEPKLFGSSGGYAYEGLNI